MTTTRGVQNAFSSGEIDPLLEQRPDFQRFQTGLAICCGYVPFRQGGFTRAPGTIHKGTTKDNKFGVRIPFTFNRMDSLALEFTDQVMRVWRYGTLIESGGSPYELATPFLEADLPNLSYVQEGDLVYVADGKRDIQVISRFALDDWTIAAADLKSGPFRVQNLDEAKTIQASATTGTITLTGTGDIFSAAHVGALFLLKPTDFTAVPIWVGNQPAAVDDLCLYDDRIYKLTAGTNTGFNPPIHTAGKVRTSLGTPVEWEFQSETKGVVRITGFTDANTVTAEVLKALPQPCVDDPSYRWSEGAWNQIYGYPSKLGRYRRRLYAGNTPSEPRMVRASRIGDFLNFEPGDLTDDSFSYDVGGDENLNEITWFAKGKRGIEIGTAGSVLRGFSTVSTEPIGPLTFDTDLTDPDGAASAQPIAPYGYPVYVSIDTGRVHEARYSFELNDAEPLELSLPSQHLGAQALEQIVWQSVADKYAWIRRADGILLLMVYDPRQDVLGWARVPVAGGHVENVDITVSADGRYDVLTAIVRRTINGQTVRYIEEQAINRPALLGQAPLTDLNHAFASSVFSGAPTDTFSCPHLANQTVYAWTDLGHYGPLTADENGDVTLPDAVSSAIIGLADGESRARTLPIPARARDGEPRGRKMRLEGPTGIGLYKTVAGWARSVEKDFQQPEQLGDLGELIDRGAALNILEGFGGIARFDVPSGHADAVALEFIPEGIAPMTILSLVPNITEANA